MKHNGQVSSFSSPLNHLRGTIGWLYRWYRALHWRRWRHTPPWRWAPLQQGLRRGGGRGPARCGAIAGGLGAGRHGGSTTGTGQEGSEKIL